MQRTNHGSTITYGTYRREHDGELVRVDGGLVIDECTITVTEKDPKKAVKEAMKTLGVKYLQPISIVPTDYMTVLEDELYNEIAYISTIDGKDVAPAKEERVLFLAKKFAELAERYAQMLTEITPEIATETPDTDKAGN